jgi:hypothetical protein
MPSKETVKLFGVIFFIAATYLYVSGDDYQKKFAKAHTIQYNCKDIYNDDLITVPIEVLDLCQEKNRRSVIVKIY